MREKPLVDKVDVVIGSEGEERLVTVAKPIADRWPDVYRPAETAKGNKTAAATHAPRNRPPSPPPLTCRSLRTRTPRPRRPQPRPGRPA
jgi:hypothetical protein